MTIMILLLLLLLMIMIIIIMITILMIMKLLISLSSLISLLLLLLLVLSLSVLRLKGQLVEFVPGGATCRVCYKCTLLLHCVLVEFVVIPKMGGKFRFTFKLAKLP